MSSWRMTCSPGACTPTVPGRSTRPPRASTRNRSSSRWPKPARLRPTDPRRMLEREVKLGVPPAFSLPDLEDIAAAVETSPVDERRLETVYYDTPDLRLARWGANLRIRQGEGWTLKLPSTSEGPALTRRELEFQGDPSRPPDAPVALVIAYLRRASLVPVASLSTLRRRVQLKNRDGTVLAEVGDDDVSVVQGRRVESRFREVVVEVQGQAGGGSRGPITAWLGA